MSIVVSSKRSGSFGISSNGGKSKSLFSIFSFSRFASRYVESVFSKIFSVTDVVSFDRVSDVGVDFVEEEATGEAFTLLD